MSAIWWRARSVQWILQPPADESAWSEPKQLVFRHDKAPQSWGEAQSPVASNTIVHTKTLIIAALSEATTTFIFTSSSWSLNLE